MQQNRISIHKFYMQLAKVVSLRSTCSRSKVGCVVLDKNNHVIATGYNGVPRNAFHCIDYPCAGASEPSGEGLEKCEAIHAEANALIQCKDTQEIQMIYVTHSPCIFCARMIANTSCKYIYYETKYAHEQVFDLLWKLDINLYQVTEN